MSEKKKNDFLMYKGKPLVRKDKTIYYGYMSDPYFVVLQITSFREFKGLEIADKVSVQLVDSNPDVVRLKDKIVKKTERRGLYSAIDIGSIWLERALRDSA